MPSGFNVYSLTSISPELEGAKSEDPTEDERRLYKAMLQGNRLVDRSNAAIENGSFNSPATTKASQADQQCNTPNKTASNAVAIMIGLCCCACQKPMREISSAVHPVGRTSFSPAALRSPSSDS
jgi:hypothetical protein